MNELTQQYRRFNESHPTALVFHLGIDAGFFAEFSYMIHAMFYAAVHRYRFVLYSADANFATGKGWTDYFEPFCEEVDEPFHHTFNVHAIPRWSELARRAARSHRPELLWWKLKNEGKGWVEHWLCRRAYGPGTLTTHDLPALVPDRFDLPELGIHGNYPEAFRQLVRMVWHLNADTRKAVDELTESLHLPPLYAGTQLRGGDKITEVNLQPTSLSIEALRRQEGITHVLALTDDYTLFEQARREAPEFCWHTLCRPEERGYVNSAFTHTDPAAKRTQMLRFLAQIDALMKARPFVGSITNGPSLFLLKMLGADGIALDCRKEDFPHLSHQGIALRGKAAEDYLHRQEA